MDKITQHLPSIPASLRPSRQVVIAATAAAIITIGPVVYLRYRHSELKKRINHVTSCKIDDLSSVVDRLDLKSIPLSEPGEPSGECRIFNDRCSRTIPKSLLPDLNLKEMLNVYLRRNMLEFSSYPPALLMKRRFKKYPEVQRSFEAELIKKMEFEEREWVCGYQVFYRSEEEMELGVAIEPQHKDAESGAWKGPGPFKGRLCFAIRETKEKRVVNGAEDREEEVEMLEFYTTTIMYTWKEEKSKMLMEQVVPRFFHEVGSWTLLVGGTDYLMELKRKGLQEKI